MYLQIKLISMPYKLSIDQKILEEIREHIKYVPN